MSVSAEPRAGAAGSLGALAPLPFALALWAGGPNAATPWTDPAVVLSSALLLAASFLIERLPIAGRIAGSVGLVGAFAPVSRELFAEPARALAVLIAAAGTLILLWTESISSAAHRSPSRRARARVRAAATVALGSWIAGAMVNGMDFDRIDGLAGAAAFAIALGGALRWTFLIRETRPRRARSVRIAVALAAALALLFHLLDQPELPLVALAAGATAILVIVPHPRRRAESGANALEILLGHPERLLVGTFASLCLGGSLLLSLPQCAADGYGIGFGDATFTAVSAVCVTGLSVRDTAHEFSFLGQAVILVMIQLGGLGIMTFSTAALRLLGGRMSLRHERAVASLIGNEDRGRLVSSAQRIVVVTFVAETIGAILLFLAFRADGEDPLSALWRAVFTSVSAFCNAGFALQSDSLVGYADQPFVLHVVGALIVVGGLSPAAVLAVPRLFRRPGPPISAQVKISLAASVFLLFAGFVLVLASEWTNALDGRDGVARVHNAWFQSVTLRTAGFNSIPMESLRPATILVMLVMMFIGGCPGGTAGGVKVTTVAILAFAVFDLMRGGRGVVVFGRRVSDRSLRKAAVIATLGLGGSIIATLAILLTQRMPADLAVFEVFSALGTVGLTLGATSRLDTVGRLVIIACMFVGRVGTLTLLMSPSGTAMDARLDRPEEDVDVG